MPEPESAPSHGGQKASRFRWFDEQLQPQWRRYLGQSLLATLVLWLISTLLDATLGTTLVASLGASTFIVFAMPSSIAARTRSVLGGYLLSAGAGVICTGLALWWGRAQGGAHAPIVVSGALAVGLSMLLMVSLDCEHPPAAGLALGLVTEPWDWRTLLAALAAVSGLALAHRALRRWLLDLT